MVRRVFRLGSIAVLVLWGPPAWPQAQGSSSFFTFNRTDAPAIGAPRAIVSADFNRDGFADVALGGTTRDSIGILFHHGFEEGDEGQRFEPMKEIVVGGGPFELAAGDLNRDGLPDIVVANADMHSVTVLLNDDTHQFTRVIDHPVANNPRGLAVADFDRDGKLDVFVTNYMGATVQLLPGLGDGMFNTRVSFSAPAYAQGVAAADFNHDGWADAAVASVTGVVSFYYMHPAGADRQDVRPGSDGWNVITAGDFNRDGLDDVAVASTAGSVVQVLLQSSSGTWTAGPALPVAASPRGIEAADVDRDGVLDLVVSGRAASTVSVLRGDGQGHFERTDVAAGPGARDIAVTRFNEDVYPDILTANEFGHSVTILDNVRQPSPAGYAFDRMEIPHYWRNSAYAVADFNHNGKLDVVRDTDVLLDGATVVPVGHGPAGVADFNLDGHEDIVFGQYPEFRTFYGDGRGNFALRTTFWSGGRILRLRVGDMNRDGRADIVYVSERGDTAGALQVWLGVGDGTFRPTVDIEMARGRWLELADVNRDGITDVGVSLSSGLAVFLGDGTGRLSAPVMFGEGTVRNGFAFGDVTSDNIPDVVIADGSASYPNYGPNVTVARGNGDGTFETIEVIDTAVYSPWITNVGLLLGDLTNDGVLDIFLSSVQLLAGNGSGAFDTPQPFAGHGSFDMLLADVNGDTLLDVLGVNGDFGANAAYYLNSTRFVAQNRAPEGVDLPASAAFGYADQFAFHDDDPAGVVFNVISAVDPDAHDLRYRWTLEDGTVLSESVNWSSRLPPGTHHVTVTVDDYRGASASDTMTVTIAPHKETVLHVGLDQLTFGAWTWVQDDTEAPRLRYTHPDAGAPKLQAPLASPADYIELAFVADPTQEYKLWLRMKAEGDSWANDSVFVQFSGATDAAGNPVYRTGTASAMAVNLEECSGCGISGWGWEDDAWGAPDRHGVTLRFPEGGQQVIRIQTREDGVSIDQIVLSAEKYLTTRPGSAKNDTTKLPWTGPWLAYDWDR